MPAGCIYEIFINKISPNFGIYEIFPYDYGNAGWLIFRKNAEIFWKDGILYGKFSESVGENLHK